MKISISKLKKIVNEELNKSLTEAAPGELNPAFKKLDSLTSLQEFRDQLQAMKQNIIKALKIEPVTDQEYGALRELESRINDVLRSVSR
jgi:hypothetical protein